MFSFDLYYDARKHKIKNTNSPFWWEGGEGWGLIVSLWFWSRCDEIQISPCSPEICRPVVVHRSVLLVGRGGQKCGSGKGKWEEPSVGITDRNFADDSYKCESLYSVAAVMGSGCGFESVLWDVRGEKCKGGILWWAEFWVVLVLGEVILGGSGVGWRYSCSCYNVNTAWTVFILRPLTHVAGAVCSKRVVDRRAGVARSVQ